MGHTILIADDHEDNRELLHLVLRGAGYSVREAKDGSECLELARAEIPDLIVMDLSMPVLDGWGLFEELKVDQRTRGIPCIVLTAHADLDRNRAIDKGFAAYVSKPFATEHLLSTVAAALAHDKATQ
ncbi:MAG TPA: response regulator [Pyrinomonadaceae bacterium]|nr:response regulator [Pyrinomonadaceae bacterium]